MDHAAAGDAALHAKDAAGANISPHFVRLKGSGGEDEIHALAHLALCYEQQSKFGDAATHYDRAAEVRDKTDQASASTPRRAQLAQRAQMCYEKNGEDSKSAASCARETRRCADDAELALKCAGAFAQRYRKVGVWNLTRFRRLVATPSRPAGKEKKSKALVLPALTVAAETATKARKQNPKCLKTASQRLLLATVLDALADGLSTQKQFKDALPKAERALKEYDAVAKAHLRAKNEDENFRAARGGGLRSSGGVLPRRCTSTTTRGTSSGTPRTATRACPSSWLCGPGGPQRGAVLHERRVLAGRHAGDHRRRRRPARPRTSRTTSRPRSCAIALDLPKNSHDDKAAIQSLLAVSGRAPGVPNDAVGPRKKCLSASSTRTARGQRF